MYRFVYLYTCLYIRKVAEFIMTTSIIPHENRLAVNDVVSLDKSLPLWARRSNPIIRRQLGAHWRVFPPELRPIAIWIGYYIAFLALSLTGADFIFIFFIPFALVSAVVFPAILYLYIRSLGQVIADSATAMVTEYTHDSLTLLRTTPFNTMEIILSKISGTVWRRMDDLQDITTYTRTMGGMVILGSYIVLFNPANQPHVAQFLSLPMLIASLVRVPLELVMVASIATMLGAYTKSRNSAILATTIFAFFYFLLLLLFRFLGWHWSVQWVIDAVLPIVLPIGIIYGSLRMTQKAIESD